MAGVSGAPCLVQPCGCGQHGPLRGGWRSAVAVRSPGMRGCLQRAEVVGACLRHLPGAWVPAPRPGRLRQQQRRERHAWTRPLLEDHPKCGDGLRRRAWFVSTA